MKQVWSTFLGRIVLAMVSLASVSNLQAQSGDRPRGNAIIFSAPKSDTVSSNLNDLRTPSSPFREMESALKKPFNSFEPQFKASRDIVRPTPQPQPDLRRKSEKELMNERAEQLFLDPSAARDEKEDDLYNLSSDANDPYSRKPKTALDRYYDRVDRAITNRPTGSGLTDYNRPSGLEESLATATSPKNSPGLNRNDNSPGNPFRSSTNPFEPKRESFFSNRSGNDSRDERPMNTGVGFSYRQEKVDRLDAFKQLLEGSGAQRSTKPTPNANSAYQPAANTSSDAAGGYGSRSSGHATGGTAQPRDSFAKSAGLVGTPGKPMGLPDYAASSKPTPAAQPKPVPIPKYNPPRRNF